MAKTKEPFVRRYRPEPTLALFHSYDTFVRGIKGPIGSGKSSACCIEIYRRAMLQRPHQGVRKSKWAIIRQTYPMLKSTTIKTWSYWFPTQVDGQPFCPIVYDNPIRGHLQIPDIGDGTALDLELAFLACDDENDAIEKLKSLEVTGVWVNEAGEVSWNIIAAAASRTGRYPAKDDGGFNWTGMIMDTNPPNTDSWWYDLAEKKRPKGITWFNQPPAMILDNPERLDIEEPRYVRNEGQVPGISAAENIGNLELGWAYYERLIPLNTPDWIKVFVCGEYGQLRSGKPIYPEYNDRIHCAKSKLDAMKGVPLIVGWDYGNTPAIAVCQMTPMGQFRVLDEIVTNEMGPRKFVQEKVRPLLGNKYHGWTIYHVGDPSGKQESNEISTMQILMEEGIPIEMAPTNIFQKRRDAVAKLLLSHDTDGTTAFLLSPNCEVLRAGFQTHYALRKLRVPGTEQFRTVPDKNIYSHVQDAVQYAACSALGIQDEGNYPSLNYRNTARAVSLDTQAFAAWS